MELDHYRSDQLKVPHPTAAAVEAAVVVEEQNPTALDPELAVEWLVAEAALHPTAAETDAAVVAEEPDALACS